MTAWPCPAHCPCTSPDVTHCSKCRTLTPTHAAETNHGTCGACRAWLEYGNTWTLTGIATNSGGTEP